MSWQIVPKQLMEMLRDTDKTKVKRAGDAIMTMKKPNIAELQKAFNGGSDI